MVKFQMLCWFQVTLKGVVGCRGGSWYVEGYGDSLNLKIKSFEVSWCLGLLVAWFQSFKVSKFQNVKALKF